MRGAALWVLLLVAGPGAAVAQVPVGGVFQVDAQTGYQFFSAPLVGHDGSFVVVWSSYQHGTPNNEVFAQRYSPDGLKLGAEMQVNTYTTGSQGGPHAAALADGGFVVAFVDNPADSIWARRYSAGGVARGPDFQVGSSADGLPWVAADPRGGFVIAWDTNDGSGHGVFARRYDRASEPIGSEFQINSYTTGTQGLPRVAFGGSGAFTVAWTGASGQDGSGYGIYARRYDAAGQALGGEFRVNTYTPDDQFPPEVALDRQDNAIVVWSSRGQDGSSFGVYGQLYDAAGLPRGSEFRVNTYTTGSQSSPSVAVDEGGNFVVAWEQGTATIMGRRYDAQGVPRSGEFLIGPDQAPDQYDVGVASDRHGNFLASWTLAPTFHVLARRYGWILPGQLRVDPAATATSDGNHILEPGERVPVQTGWRNRSAGAQTLSGTASSFTGPPGATYTLRDATATYGSVAVGALGLCATGGDCFEVEIPAPAARPVTHWDAVLTERLAPDVQGQVAAWRLHVGDSFTDMPRSSSYYLWVEALLHNGVTGGCTATEYCGSAATTREQMAVFLVAGRAGPYYAPAACQGAPVFPDVPVASPYCRWIEELSRLGVTAGCGGGNYCPTANVSRQEMAVFVLRTAEPGINPPACATPLFADVPPLSPYCRWIEELARRGVVTGCGGGNFCPNDPVSREQMAVFIVLTYGLGLYEP